MKFCDFDPPWSHLWAYDTHADSESDIDTTEDSDTIVVIIETQKDISERIMDND